MACPPHRNKTANEMRKGLVERASLLDTSFDFVTIQRDLS
jgi:hypothetical protein